MSTDIVIQATAAVVIGAGAGLVGSLMVLRRMALVGDALSHVALPGIAAALLLALDPFIGAVASLLLAVIGIWALERYTRLPTETLVGIAFTISLAIGLLLMPEPELLEALFGDLSSVTFMGAFWSCMIVAAVAFGTVSVARPVLLGILSPDLAKASGVRLDRMNLLFLAMVAIVTALGITITGTLLTGALVIIPAAAARNVTRSLARYMAASALLGAVSGGAGVALSVLAGLAPGPSTILAAGTVFLLSVPLKH